jgi:hypothetical protein
VTRCALTVQQMDEIRAGHAQGLVTVLALAREYHVGVKTIRRVLRESPSEYGKARRAADNKYGTSERGRARRRRADRKYNDAGKSRSKARARKYGVTDAEVQQMLREQKYKCPITLRPVDERSAVDHAHGVEPPYAARGILANSINSIIGRTDQDLIAFSVRVRKYAGKRIKVQSYLHCLRDLGNLP